MCSNTCNSACGCGTGVNVVSSIWNSGLKKQQKRPRVPKRGPGVAELEKILREQGRVEITTDKGNSEEFSSFMSHPSNPYSSSSSKFHPLQPSTTQKTTLPSSSPLSTTLATNAHSVTIFDHLGPASLPAITSMYGKCGSLERNGGSGLVSPEKELFPLNLNSCKSNLNMNEPVDGNRYDSASSPSRNLSNDWPYSAKIQHTNNHYSAPITPMINQFRGTPTIGPQNHPELPSNQSPYNYTSRVPEEQKVGRKRSHSSTLENSLIPPSNFHVLPSFSHFNRQHQSSINDSHGTSSFHSTKECYRDAKWGSTLELSNPRFNSDMKVSGHANFQLSSPEVPSPPMHLFPVVISKGNMLPSHVSEDKLDSFQHLESSESNRRPFYNFLEVDDDSEVTDKMQGANRGGREEGSVGIDLNLKL